MMYWYLQSLENRCQQIVLDDKHARRNHKIPIFICNMCIIFVDSGIWQKHILNAHRRWWLLRYGPFYRLQYPDGHRDTRWINKLSDSSANLVLVYISVNRYRKLPCWTIGRPLGQGEDFTTRSEHIYIEENIKNTDHVPMSISSYTEIFHLALRNLDTEFYLSRPLR